MTLWTSYAFFRTDISSFEKSIGQRNFTRRRRILELCTLKSRPECKNFQMNFCYNRISLTSSVLFNLLCFRFPLRGLNNFVEF